MKSFCNNTVSKEKLRKIIVAFAKSKNVNRVYFNNTAKFIKGSYNATMQTMFLSNKESKQSMLCAFFHELSHHLAVKQKKWLNYHYHVKNSSTLQMFKVENGIDKIAKKLWNKHVDIKQWGKYKYTYPKTQKKSLMRWLKNYYT